LGNLLKERETTTKEEIKKRLGRKSCELNQKRRGGEPERPQGGKENEKRKKEG